MIKVCCFNYQAENPEDEDEEGVAKIVNVDDLNSEEMRYLLSKLLAMSVSQCCAATQRDSRVRELENKIAQITHQSTLHQQLLQHMIEQQDLEVYDLMLADQAEDDDDATSDLDSADEISVANTVVNNLNLDNVMSEDGVGSDSSLGRREKARRKMINREDLLFNDVEVSKDS